MDHSTIDDHGLTRSVANNLFRIKAYLSYWLNAVDEHSLHSPFFYGFYTTLLKPPLKPGQFEHIEKLRRALLHDDRTISVMDFGAKKNQNPLRKVSYIARTSLSSARFSAFYFRIANSIMAQTIMELGTSLGINTLYFAEHKPATIITFEGSAGVAETASLTFGVSGKKNIEMISGEIDITLPAVLQRVRKVDLSFIDANHRYEPTLRYFEWLLEKSHERSVIIVDDIHYSPEMERAWTAIKNHRLVYGSIDLFRCGIVFFDPSLNKQHVILQV